MELIKFKLYFFLDISGFLIEKTTQLKIRIMSYYEDKCFPASQLKTKIGQELYPFVNIQSKTIVKKDKRNRLQLVLQSRTGERKTISLLLSIEYPPSFPSAEGQSKVFESKTGSATGTGNKYFINTQSFENVVEGHKKMNIMQKELDSQIFEDISFDDDEILH